MVNSSLLMIFIYLLVHFHVIKAFLDLITILLETIFDF